MSAVKEQTVGEILRKAEALGVKPSELIDAKKSMRPNGKRARKARAKAARPGTVAADHRIRIQDKPGGSTIYLSENPVEHGGDPLVSPDQYFSDEELSTMPLLVRPSATGLRTRVWRDPRGGWHREAGRVRIQVRDGRRAYVIIVWKGANADDLNYLKSIVDSTRANHSHRVWTRLTADWADDRTLELVFDSRNYGDPYTHSDTSPRIVICTEPRCREQWHEDGDYHTLDRVEKKLARWFSYEIEISKMRADDSWTIDVTGPEISEATPDQVASFVSDLQWMAEECRRANQPAQIAEEVPA